MSDKEFRPERWENQERGHTDPETLRAEFRERLYAKPFQGILNGVIVRPNIIFVGDGRSGKDTAVAHFATHSGWKPSGTCSLYMLGHMAEFLGIDAETAYRDRHLHRALWREQGDLLRREDPLALVRPMMQAGRVGGGVRGLAEIRAARSICDLVVWVNRPGNPKDPTMEFGPEEADLVLVNDGDLEAFDEKLRRLAVFATTRLALGATR